MITVTNKWLCFCLCSLILILFLFTTTYRNINLLVDAETTCTDKLPEINLNQTANMKIVFLGVPSEYINQTELAVNLPQHIRQWVYPNNMTWNLNTSFVFCSFPEDVSDSLRSNAFYLEDSVYFLSLIHISEPTRPY
mgnify:CR=1 FL=1